MKKYLTLLLIIVITPLIGGLYGILHDQFTYKISPEYYTKFKFYQFGLLDSGEEAILIFPYPRIQVAIVGFLATWWMGLFIGIILGAVGFIHTNSRQMLQATLGAIIVTMIITFVIGLLGLVLGELQMNKPGAEWWLPSNVEWIYW